MPSVFFKSLKTNSGETGKQYLNELYIVQHIVFNVFPLDSLIYNPAEEDSGPNKKKMLQ